MAYHLGDLFIGDFPLLRSFAANPDVYSARYGLRGHNGLDFATPNLTLVLSVAEGIVKETGFDSGGYGNFVTLLHDGFLSLYGHLNDVVVKTGDKVLQGQLIAHSGISGNTDTPSLHFAISPASVSGDKIEKDNGFGGFIDPMGPTCLWSVLGLSEPVVQRIEEIVPIKVDPAEFSLKSIQANNYQTIIAFLQQHALGDLLKEINPSDPSAGKLITQVLAEALKNMNNLGQTISSTVVKTNFSQTEEEMLTAYKEVTKAGFLDKLTRFIFVR